MRPPNNYFGCDWRDHCVSTSNRPDQLAGNVLTDRHSCLVALVVFPTNNVNEASHLGEGQREVEETPIRETCLIELRCILYDDQAGLRRPVASVPKLSPLTT